MSLEYAVCPHCGCRCEDDDYCAACGKLFHEDVASGSNASLLKILGRGLRSFAKGSGKQIDQTQKHSIHSLDKGSELIEQDFCPTWSTISSNIYNDDDK